VLIEKILVPSEALHVAPVLSEALRMAPVLSEALRMAPVDFLK
jgi:hypothetical protein